MPSLSENNKQKHSYAAITAAVANKKAKIVCDTTKSPGLTETEDLQF
jgi:hypothetical protein